MNKQQAIEIIEREPVGGAQFYNLQSKMFFKSFSAKWYLFDGEWKRCITNFTAKRSMMKMHEILEIALGED